MLPTPRDLARDALLLLALLCNFQVSGGKYDDLACTDMKFPCKPLGKCFPQSRVNDGHPDCPDGSDEYNGNDTSQNIHMDEFMVKRPEPYTLTNCSIDYHPPNCSCSDVSVFCDDVDLTEVPNKLSTRIVTLTFRWNRIELIQPSAFKELHNLKTLILIRNNLKTFSSDAFSEDNALKELDLSYNEIDTLEPNCFERLRKLIKLNLDYNNISRIQKGLFANLTNLKFLNLNNNRIKYIDSGSFLPLKHLLTIGINNNLLSDLSDGTLSGIRNVTFLDLSDNRIGYISAGAFTDLVNIKSLELSGNRFYHVPVHTFTYLKNLEFIAFYLCAYATSVKTCIPRGDGISSHENLLDSSILRVAIWVMAILACVGNCVVLTGRLILKEDNRIHSFLIRNLSVADLLMGVYLLVIGGHDTWYRGRYLAHDLQWRNSWSCDVSGFLSTVSSEVSVLTLTVVTLDRYICVTYPLTLRKMNIKLAYFIMTCIWLFCIGLAGAPLTGIPYFGSYFYRHNAVCVPLLLHEPRNRGWEYSAFIFLGINLASVLFMAYAYVAMLVAIRRSCFRSLHQSQERCLMKRFFFIVVTDWACWVPIIALKVAALTGTKLPLDIYAWIVVFVLPVNCAINPLVYTLTTRIFKQKFLVTFTSMVWKGRAYQENSTSVSIIKSRSSRREGAEVERFPLQDDSQINTWTGRMVVKYGQRRSVYPSLTTHKDLQIGYTSDS